jgi:hypothetical protein
MPAEHTGVVAEATKWTGDWTVPLGLGLDTVTPANADIVRTVAARNMKGTRFCMKTSL